MKWLKVVTRIAVVLAGVFGAKQSYDVYRKRRKRQEKGAKP